jgi:tRNA pseudouridine38-40 synthase
MRVALGLEYDGSQYHGWQSQPELNTVQRVLENALSKINNHRTEVQCAGRTDTGVHALNQVVHFETTSDRNMRAYIYGVNTHLPKDVSVKWSKEVPDSFSARFSATARTYHYYIYNHPIRSAQFRNQLTWHYRPLDDRLMAEAACILVGEHDFSSFRSAECQSNTPNRNVHKVEVDRFDDLICFKVTANAFLHHMVRNIVGVLMAVGSGRKPVEWVNELLVKKDRKLAAETAPPYGLYLTNVIYPESYNLPETSSHPLLLNFASRNDTNED